MPSQTSVDDSANLSTSRVERGPNQAWKQTRGIARRVWQQSRCAHFANQACGGIITAALEESDTCVRLIDQSRVVNRCVGERRASFLAHILPACLLMARHALSVR